MNVIKTLALLKLTILLAWPLTVHAAVITGDPFSGISGLHVLVMSIISTLSGLTALTIRMDTELRKIKNKQLPRPVLFVASHMMGSWLAGIMAFAIAQQSEFSIWPQITIVIAASFAGAKFIEKASEMYMGKKESNV